MFTCDGTSYCATQDRSISQRESNAHARQLFARFTLNLRIAVSRRRKVVCAPRGMLVCHKVRSPAPRCAGERTNVDALFYKDALQGVPDARPWRTPPAGRTTRPGAAPRSASHLAENWVSRCTPCRRVRLGPSANLSHWEDNEVGLAKKWCTGWA